MVKLDLILSIVIFLLITSITVLSFSKGSPQTCILLYILMSIVAFIAMVNNFIKICKYGKHETTDTRHC